MVSSLTCLDCLLFDQYLTAVPGKISVLNKMIDILFHFRYLAPLSKSISCLSLSLHSWKKSTACCTFCSKGTSIHFIIILTKQYAMENSNPLCDLHFWKVCARLDLRPWFEVKNLNTDYPSTVAGKLRAATGILRSWWLLQARHPSMNFSIKTFNAVQLDGYFTKTKWFELMTQNFNNALLQSSQELNCSSSRSKTPINRL